MNTTDPLHIGIIMDGNGRWADMHGLTRSQGHSKGAQVAKRCVQDALKCNIKYLSLYVLSTENWKRSKLEVSTLLKVIADNVRKEENFYIEHGVRVVHSGSKQRIPQRLIDDLEWVEERTKSFDNVVVNLAIDYGGRDEIIRAIHRFYRTHAQLSSISGADITEYLDVPLLPYPDMIIRTGGEYRLSNFLLWESAYTEFYFCETLWPDWNRDDLETALTEYYSRQRSFGGARVNKDV